MQIKISVLVCFLASFVACTSSNEGVISYPNIENMQTISVPNADFANIKNLDELVDSTFVVKLKPYQNYFIGVISKVLFTKTMIIIFDLNSQAIFVYNYQGDCISYLSLNRNGKVDRYKVFDIDVDEKQNLIMVKDDFRRKIIYFNMDGKLLNKTKSAYFGKNFRKLNNHLFAFYNSFSSLYNDKHLYRLFFVSDDNKIIRQYFPYQKKMQSDRIIQLPEYFHKSNETLMFIDEFSYSAYAVNETGLIGKYRFDFNKFNLPEGRHFSANDKDSTQIAILHYLYETKNHLVFKYVIRAKNAFLSILDKRTGKLYKKLIFQSNENVLLTGNKVVGIHDDYFVQYVEPYTYTNYSKNTSELNKCLLIHGLDKMKPTDNPILVFSKFK